MKRFVFALFLFCSCRQDPVGTTSPPFEINPVLHPVAAGILDEASGIADSYVNPGYLWVNQDSDKPTELYLLEQNGQYRKKIFIKNVTNRDWEEITVAYGPVPGKRFIYIGETGDNNQVFSEYVFYRMEEPSANADTVSQIDQLKFKYPDGSHDAEAFFVDDATKDIYIITKRDARSKVYKLTYPQSATSLNTAAFVMELPYSGVVGCSYLAARNELLIKTYDRIYFYKTQGQSIADLLGSSSTVLPYEPEPQGEAITFTNNNTGFFTLSEKGFSSGVSLRFYKRK